MTTTTTPTIPAGYWQSANGSLVPLARIKDIDKRRTKLVEELCAQAKGESDRLQAFKVSTSMAIAEFVTESLADYGVKRGGEKGNITLVTFDGRFKIVRQMQETIAFDERLQAAKSLIDECIQDWSKGSNLNMKVLVLGAFQVDQAGKINTGRVLGLRLLKITHPTWLLAMQAITDSMRVSSTKPYIRFYERDAAGAYQSISLDVAGV